jgi:hypothetical protein
VLKRLLLVKKLTGNAAIQARARANADGVSIEEAARRNRIERVRNTSAVYSKTGKLLKRLSARNLAVTYALESIGPTRKKKGCCSALKCGLPQSVRIAGRRRIWKHG